MGLVTLLAASQAWVWLSPLVRVNDANRLLGS
jgi:hypothetical protein